MVATPSEERGSSELRASILAAATELFADRGYAATTMREVAKAAACTKPALYYYFDSKAALFLEVIRGETDNIRDLIERSFSQPGTVRERLQHAMDGYFDHVRNNRLSLKVLWRAELHNEAGQPSFDWRSARSVYWEMTLRLLEEGVESGEIRTDTDLLDAVHLLAGAVDIRCNLWVLQGEPIPDDCGIRALALLFEGIGT